MRQRRATAVIAPRTLDSVLLSSPFLCLLFDSAALASLPSMDAIRAFDSEIILAVLSRRNSMVQSKPCVASIQAEINNPMKQRILNEMAITLNFLDGLFI